MFASLTERWRESLPLLSAAGIALLLCLLLGFNAWRWFGAAPPELARAKPRVSALDSAAQDPLPRILSGNLFGSARSNAGANAAPREATGFTLRAAFAASGGGAGGGAIIEASGSEARWFAVGDTLPGGVTLQEVHSDHVLLDRGGVAERLEFPPLGDINRAAVASIETGGDAPRVQPGRAEPIPADAPAEEKARIIRQRLEELRNRSRT